MKKIFTMMLLALVCGMALQAQEAEYQPLVREGVKWINRYQIDDYSTGRFLPEIYYMLEFHGDTTVTTEQGNLDYHKLYRTLIKPSAPEDDYHSSTVFNDSSPAALLREEGKKVYCLIKNDLIEGFQNDTSKEFLLYDFANEEQAAVGWFVPDWVVYEGNLLDYYTWNGQTLINDANCKVFQKDDNLLIESIGLVSSVDGDLITLYKYRELGVERNIGLSHVIDADGNIIYRGPNYRFFARDINGDGQVDISDVNEVINMMLGKSDISPVDITGDGQVDISDVNAVINAMLGK